MTKISKNKTITKSDQGNSELSSLTKNRHIAPYLSQNYFMDYAPLFNAMANNNILSDANLAIHKMSDPKNDNPYTVSQSDNCHTANEILQYQLIRHVGLESVDQKQNLISALTKTLQEAGYPQDKIDATLTSFNTEVTIEEFTSDFSNSHVLRAMAFPNAKAFRAALHDIKQNRPKKNYEIELSPKYLLALAKAGLYIVSYSPHFFTKREKRHI